jgi:hypothetical protein
LSELRLLYNKARSMMEEPYLVECRRARCVRAAGAGM